LSFYISCIALFGSIHFALFLRRVLFDFGIATGALVATIGGRHGRPFITARYNRGADDRCLGRYSNEALRPGFWGYSEPPPHWPLSRPLSISTMQAAIAASSVWNIILQTTLDRLLSLNRFPAPPRERLLAIGSCFAVSLPRAEDAITEQMGSKAVLAGLHAWPTPIRNRPTVGQLAKAHTFRFVTMVAT
jgi:hypothetical protein